MLPRNSIIKTTDLNYIVCIHRFEVIVTVVFLYSLSICTKYGGLSQGS